jgi:hypothetical protein
MLGSRPKLVTKEQPQSNCASDSFVILALVTTFVLCFAPFPASRLLWAPYLDSVHVYGPIFSEVSRLALSGTVPYYLPSIGTGFPIFEGPHLSILYPFYFFGFNYLSESMRGFGDSKKVQAFLGNSRKSSTQGRISRR